MSTLPIGLAKLTRLAFAGVDLSRVAGRLRGMCETDPNHAGALMDLAVNRKFPLGNGIITVNTDAQAWARARASELNKGGDAARAALAMLRIKRRLAKA